MILRSRKALVIIVIALIAVATYDVVHISKRNQTRHKSQLISHPEETISQASQRWVTGDYRLPNSWAKDPFDEATVAMVEERPKSYSGEKILRSKKIQSVIKISGVIIDGNLRAILVGDTLLKEGDRIGTLRIKTINRYQVVVENQDGSEVVQLID